jgi:integrase/recombinase XerD
MSPRFPSLLQSFFAARLLTQRQVSPHTIAAYRDTFRLLLTFASKRLAKAPTDLELEDLGAPLIADFLEHLEEVRGNSARTRNARLAAIHSFFRYVAFQEPAQALLCRRVLAIPSKRSVRRPVSFLNREEIEALVAAPDPTTRTGRRDRVLLQLALETGLRVSELVGLRCADVVLGAGAHVHCQGKGRKERTTPLRKEAAALLRAWLKERGGRPDDPLFPNPHGGFLSRDAVERLVAKHTMVAGRRNPSLLTKKVSPHVLRHSTAMELLRHGVDRAVIALWLGHEGVETTEMYLHADMHLKEKALSHVSPLGTTPGRYHPDDQLLAFLESL